MKYDVNYIQSEFGLYGFGTIDIKMDEVDVAGIKSRTCFEDIILFTIMYVVIGSIAGLIMFRWFGVFLPLVGGIGVLILYSFISKYIAWPKASFVMKRESIKDITLKERTVEFTAEHPVLETPCSGV